MTQRYKIGSLLAVGILLITLTASISAAGQTFTVINTFNKTDGAQPMGSLVFDGAGNLYGTTSAGGLGKGVVFELSPNGSGGWTETVLYQFGSRNKDGATPYDVLIFDANGNLYGTTRGGGPSGDGTVFELSPNGNGSWTETILHNFGSISNDGRTPIAGLTIDASGNLYGTTFLGGSTTNCTYQGLSVGCGTVFELSPAGSGNWTYTILHNFSSVDDGYFPVAGLTFGPDGGLYGEASNGFKYGKGMLYEMVPGNGTWTEKQIHPWGNVHDGRPDGGYPYSSVIFDSNGYMYGTTNVGGTHGDLGTVFRFYQNASGWDEENLHGFGNPPEGSYPESSLLDDSEGNLYGTTNEGGPDNIGTVYKLVPIQNNAYSYELVHNFAGGASDGALPTGGLVMDSAGNLYGTAPNGGNQTACSTGTAKGCGIVYEISFP